MRMMLNLPHGQINTEDFLASLGIPLPPLSRRLLQVVSTVACECPEPCLCGRSTERPPRCPRSPPNASLGRLPASPCPAIPGGTTRLSLPWFANVAASGPRFRCDASSYGILFAGSSSLVLGGGFRQSEELAISFPSGNNSPGFSLTWPLPPSTC